jgi:hypothetical protein
MPEKRELRTIFLSIDILNKIRRAITVYFQSNEYDYRIIKALFIFLSGFFGTKPYLAFDLVG